ncbi:unnamed protein product [Malus baccata var. baccata]
MQWSHLPLLVSLLIHYHIPIQVQNDHKRSDHKNLSSVLHKASEGAIILKTFPNTIMDVFALVLESMSRNFFHWFLTSKHLFFLPFRFSVGKLLIISLTMPLTAHTSDRHSKSLFVNNVSVIAHFLPLNYFCGILYHQIMY